jgi:integrase
MPLTDTAIRNAKPSSKPVRLSDGAGMYLLLQPDGAKWWRFDYRRPLTRQRNTLSFGTYPDVPLKLARERRDEARQLVARGIDPALKRQAERAAGADTFEAIAREWFRKFEPTWATTHSKKIIRRLEANVFPWIGPRAIEAISPADILTLLRRVESRGAIDTAHRAQQNCSQVFRYAIATGRATRDPSADLRGAIPPPQRQHYATITDPKGVGELLRALEGYEGNFTTSCALRLAPYVFVRPGELRKAEWSEIDLEKCEWRIPAERMKARVPHVVPLSVQSIAILSELRPLTGGGKFVFPGRSGSKWISENTINSALRRLGYDGSQFTGHSFRSMASTLLNEQGWHKDAIERQLAHGERDKVRAAYNHAEHLPERRKMMAHWADFLDSLRAPSNVVGIRTRA